MIKQTLEYMWRVMVPSTALAILLAILAIKAIALTEM